MLLGAELRVCEDGPLGLFLTHLHRLTDDIRDFVIA
jgi:hypothetical protein